MGENVTFGSNGGTAHGYLARPESGSGPGVVVVQEWWGLVPHIEKVCDRFAAEGFIALAPDLYHGTKTTEPDDAMRLMMGLAMDAAARDIGGAARYLRTQNVTGDGLAAVGFCMGGSLALWSATVAPEITTTVGFYPAIPWERMNPTWSAYSGKAAVIHCDEDEGGSGAPGIQRAKQAIEAAGGTVEVFDYPGTGHAFFNDTRPEVYNADAAQRAWQRTIDFLRSRLG